MSAELMHADFVIERRKRENCIRIVAQARNSGALALPPACEICGGVTVRLVWHHWSYEIEHALDLIGLCHACHMGVHSGRLPEPRTNRIYETRREMDVRRKAIAKQRWIESQRARDEAALLLAEQTVERLREKLGLTTRRLVAWTATAVAPNDRAS